jgi:ammonium transporter, Amt family
LPRRRSLNADRPCRHRLAARLYRTGLVDDARPGLIGNLDRVGLLGIDPTTVRSHVPELLFLTFQLGFAIVTAALVCGAIADRARFSAWMIYVAV